MVRIGANMAATERAADGELPEGWERKGPAGPYHKYVRRDAVTVPKRCAGGEPFHRDSVVVVSQGTVAISTGPGARSSWDVEDTDEAARRAIEVLQEWIEDDRDPYGGGELDDALEAVVPGDDDA